jgi:PPM family protein phosphatase
MERPHLKRFRSLFRRMNHSQQSRSPLTQDSQEPHTPSSTPEFTRAKKALSVPDCTKAHLEHKLRHFDQLQKQTVKQPCDQSVITFFGVSDAGLKRPNNEDHFIVADLTRHEIAVKNNVVVPDATHQPIGPHGILLAVADGLGGHDDGEIASHIAVEAIAQTLFALQQQRLSAAARLTLATQEAQNAICRYTATAPGSRSMSSTLTAVYIVQDTITIAQIGDSRAYRLSNGLLTQLTEDQTIVHMMLKKGMLTDEEAQNHPDKHVILQALGQGRPVSPEITHAPFQHDDCILLCSDGLSSYVDHQRIESILNEDKDEQSRCNRLLEAAYAVGGEDNVTILLARLQPVQSS